MPRILLIGTCDTKLPELLYTRSRILEHPNTEVILIDVGRGDIANDSITIPSSTLLSQYAPADTPSDISSLPRNELNKLMAACAASCIRHFHTARTYPSPIHGVIGLGGSGGTTLAAAAMREALPLGFPKLIVSTIASGDTGPVVGETDITLMYSIVDVAGLNGLLRTVLSNAAGAIVGMAGAYERQLKEQEDEAAAALKKDGEKGGKKKSVRIGITMFGVTTPCVDRIRAHLTTAYSHTDTDTDIDIYVFHATGHGGLALERLVRAGALDAVLDLTTTELCDHLCGGVMSAGPARLDAAAAAGIPCVVSLGACDMVNFGPADSVPERYRKRRLFEHNPSVTLMRTSVDECRAVGALVARKLRAAAKPEMVRVWLPKGGVSVMAEPGGPFEDGEADGALFEAVREGLRGSRVGVVEDERAINDPGFAVDVAEELAGLLGLEKKDKETKE